MAVGRIYKLLTRAEWDKAQAARVYRGSEHDRRDGFIHFSTAAQLDGTARKYFNGVPDLVLLAVNVRGLSVLTNTKDSLRWEPSRGGDLFPHLYAYLPIEAVNHAIPIPLAEDGIPILPPELES
jgi:uncharacterized protein (DUF952 family)